MKRNNINESDGLMNTIIGKDTVITGTLEVKGALRVEGTVKGKIISSGWVTVGSTGLVEAEIEAESAIVAGTMRGNVNTTEKIELQAKCEMDGDLRTKSLVIEEGAIFSGACSMKDSPPNLGFLAHDREPQEALSTDQDD